MKRGMHTPDELKRFDDPKDTDVEGTKEEGETTEESETAEEEKEAADA